MDTMETPCGKLLVRRTEGLSDDDRKTLEGFYQELEAVTLKLNDIRHRAGRFLLDHGRGVDAGLALITESPQLLRKCLRQFERSHRFTWHEQPPAGEGQAEQTPS